MSPYVAIVTPCRASTTPSSTSGTSVMQTGQPGPMITFRFLGNGARRPNFAIACSWLPQTCMTETGDRPISSVTRAILLGESGARVPDRGSERGPSPSPRDASSRRLLPLGALDLAADVRSHQVVLRRLGEQGLVERERLADFLLRNPPDREARRGSGCSPRARPADPRRPAAPGGARRRSRPSREPLDRYDPSRHTEAHQRSPSEPPATARRDQGLSDREAAVAGRHLAVEEHAKPSADSSPSDPLGEQGVLEAAARQQDRKAPPARRRRRARARPSPARPCCETGRRSRAGDRPGREGRDGRAHASGEDRGSRARRRLDFERKAPRLGGIGCRVPLERHLSLVAGLGPAEEERAEGVEVAPHAARERRTDAARRAIVRTAAIRSGAIAVEEREARPRAASPRRRRRAARARCARPRGSPSRLPAARSGARSRASRTLPARASRISPPQAVPSVPYPVPS